MHVCVVCGTTSLGYMCVCVCVCVTHRFGEMERDSLLAHGAAYLLHDRLHSCSDYHVMDVCSCCGSLLSPLTKPHVASAAFAATALGGFTHGKQGGKVVCPVCENSSKHIERVALPYVFK